MRRTFTLDYYRNHVYFSPDPPPAGGGGGGNPPPPAGGNPPPPTLAPWGEKADAVWSVADKPWYETHVAEGPAREHMRAKNYANPAVLAEANYALSKMQADPNRVAIPGADATDAQRAEFYTRLGRPATESDYKLEFPPTVQVDERMTKFAKGVGFKLGLNNSQLQQLATSWNEFAPTLEADAITASAAANDTAIGELTTKLGDKLDTYKAAGARVLKALEKNDAVKDLGLTDADFASVEKHLGSATVLKFLAAIGSLSGEAAFVGAGGGGPVGSVEAMSQEQAAAEITRLKQDKAHTDARMDKNNPGHADAVDRMQRLYARAGNKAPE